MTKKTHHKGLARKVDKKLAEQRRKQRIRRFVTFGIVGVVVLIAVGAFAATRKDHPKAAPSGAPSQAAPTKSPHAKPSSKPAHASPAASTYCPGTQPKGPLDSTKHSKPFPMTIDKSGNYSASMRTSCGTMQIQLFARQSPLTVNNFVNLSEEGWYDGLIFHRVNNDIDIIQTGDPYCVTQPSQCGSGGPGYSFPDELKNGLSLKVGSVAMANSGPDTNGSQIFIITGPAGTTLPPNYTVFGQVTKGMDVAKKIQGVPVGGSAGDTPLEQIWIDSVKIDQSK